MKAAILRKAEESARLHQSFFAERAEAIERCARAMAERLGAGGRIFTFGNGGSACDAQHLALEFEHPIFEKRRPFAALPLGADTGLLTAIGNDTDFTRAFADPLRLFAAAGDIAVAFSTSGRSANVQRALETAREIGVLTVAFTGRDGGPISDLADHGFVVPSYSIHRIQEVHVCLLHVLWDAVHLALGEDDVL
jgi:D-sedoheptulose 7-phosphate isomerase